MDFRQYDNAIGRFVGIDALAEFDYSGTPYGFGFNNPIYWSDPTGLFGTQGEALNHISQYGLTNASASYNSSRNVWEINSGGYTFWEQGTKFMVSYFNENGVFFHVLGGSGGSGTGGFGTSISGPGGSPGGSQGGSSSGAGAGGGPGGIGGGGGGRSLLNAWNDTNNFNDQVVSPVTGLIELGAIRAGTTISTANAFNKAALAETLSNVRVVKIAGSVSRVGNVLGVGYAAVVAYNNPTNSNMARFGAQVAIIAIEAGVNAFVPGLGFVVGFGLSMFEQSDYMQNFYSSLDN